MKIAKQLKLKPDDPKHTTLSHYLDMGHVLLPTELSHWCLLMTNEITGGSV